MNTIKLNNAEYTVESYSKSTYFTGDNMSTSASCTIILTTPESLATIADDDINTIQIYHDETMIYNLQNANAHVSDYSEYLSEDRMRANINFRFGEPAAPSNGLPV